MNIIGISAFNHDSACCLLQDGRLVAAVEEERFSRIKHDPRLPRASFLYCLEAAGIDLPDLDCVAFYEDSTKKLARQLWSAAAWPEVRARLTLDPAGWRRAIVDALGHEGAVIEVGHHAAHAATAYHCSGFDEAAILVCDGVGEWATTSTWRAAGGELTQLGQVDFPASLGLLYGTITGFLGFNVNTDEYKVMGLAPYGKPRYLEQLRRLVSPVRNGSFSLAMEYFDFLAGERMYSDRLAELLGCPPREPGSALDERHADIAASVQQLLEELLLALVAHLHAAMPSAHLCLTGGVALNCVANRAISERGPFARVFVQPASGDSGSCIGAAALAHRALTGRPPALGRLEHLFWGPAFDDALIREFLTAIGARFEALPAEQLIERAAATLCDGGIIGWFQGRAELGPRALGARSILADARRPDVKDRVNRVIKQRETFRPFAPVVLEAHVASWFGLARPSPFMTETCAVTGELPLPAVTHVDGSARVQTVPTDAAHPLFPLLAAFHRRTGVPVLLNTSFNLRGEPIVLTPEDAVRTFVHSDLDALFIGGFMVERAGLPAALMAARRPRFGEADPEARSTVYTFF